MHLSPAAVFAILSFTGLVAAYYPQDHYRRNAYPEEESIYARSPYADAEVYRRSPDMRDAYPYDLATRDFARREVYASLYSRDPDGTLVRRNPVVKFVKNFTKDSARRNALKTAMLAAATQYAHKGGDVGDVTVKNDYHDSSSDHTKHATAAIKGGKMLHLYETGKWKVFDGKGSVEAHSD
ncbi:hypothetical protein MMC27_000233 [Xylographa pallens]|nr:hypothetical protein [Xylographa pallens]